MKYIKSFFAFWYDFIIGDAWEVAAGVALCLIALYLITHYAAASLSSSLALLFPVIIVALLAYSLWRVRGTG